MTQSDFRWNLSAGLASVGVAFGLAALKLWAVLATGSLAVAASLIDSVLDMVMSLGGLIAIIYAAKPPDEDHAFGHSSAEDLAALGQSLFLLVSAVAIAWAAIRRLTSHEPVALANQEVGMAIMAVSVLVTGALILWQRRVARRTGNRVVAADSLHYVGDLIPALAAIVSLWASNRFDFTHVDSIVALGTAAFILRGALTIGKGAWDALMDRAADPKTVAKIERIVADWPGLAGYHDLKTRTAGAKVFVNLHVEIDGNLSLYDAHAIGAGLRQAILDACPEADVIIHQDPA
jgi:ferrous-iron efflux pump FieF